VIDSRKEQERAELHRTADVLNENVQSHQCCRGVWYGVGLKIIPAPLVREFTLYFIN